MNRKITLTGANIVFFVFVVLFIAFQFVLMFFTIIYGENFLDDKIYGILLINEYILILIPVLAYVFIKKLNIREVFRFNKIGVLPALLILLVSVPAYLAALMLNNAVVYLLQYIGDVPNQPIPVPKNIAELIVGIIIVAVSPAICEEMLHRGILLRAYENRGSMKAVVITSIFFGIFHFDITNLLGPIFLGLLIGYYVIRTNSIFAGMFAHFLNNTIAELFQYYYRDVPQPDKITISAEEMGSVILYGTIGLILVGIFIRIFKQITEGKSSIRAPISSIKNDIVSVISHWPIIVIFALYLFMIGMYLLSIIISRITGF